MAPPPKSIMSTSTRTLICCRFYCSCLWFFVNFFLFTVAEVEKLDFIESGNSLKDCTQFFRCPSHPGFFCLFFFTEIKCNLYYENLKRISGTRVMSSKSMKICVLFLNIWKVLRGCACLSVTPFFASEGKRGRWPHLVLRSTWNNATGHWRGRPPYLGWSAFWVLPES